jgi:hypothetical protein
MTGLFATQYDLVAAYARAPDVVDYGAFMGVSMTSPCGIQEVINSSGNMFREIRKFIFRFTE